MTDRTTRSLSRQLTRSTGIQLILVASAIGMLTYSLGRNSGLQRSEHHRATLPVVRVTEKLSSKLREPIHLNELNQAAINADPSLLNDFDRLGRRFWRQLKSFSVDYINYGATDGSFLGLEKTADLQLLHNEDSQRFGRGQLTVFTMSDSGERAQKESVIPGMSATHQEAWYVDTVAAGQSSWSRIYSWEDQPEIHSISYNTPIYNRQQQLLGVIGVDMVINQLSTWLQQAWQDEIGLALIVEADGTLIASSNPAIPVTQGQTTSKRSHLNELQADLPKAFTNLIKPSSGQADRSGGTTTFSTEPQLHDLDGNAFMLKATPWGSEHDLNWVLLTAVSADSAINQANRNLGIAIGISVAAMASALIINRRLIQRVLEPLSALRHASQDTEAQIRSINDPQRDILGYSCEMNQHSGQELVDLNAAIQAMVSAFNERTQELAEKEQQALALMSNKLKISLEAASIAHEINQPLSVIQLTAQSLLNQTHGKQMGTLPDELRSRIAVLREQSERVGQITDQIKAMLRSANGRHERLNLRDVIHSGLLYIRSNHRVARAWITVSDSADAAEAPAWILGDAVQLQIAIINLLKNAIEALSQAANDKVPEIVIALRDLPDHWVVEVCDNGPGLPETLTTEVPLFSSKETGTGLGLFLVRAAMESHEGQLRLSKTGPDGGTRAELILPKTT